MYFRTKMIRCTHFATSLNSLHNFTHFVSILSCPWRYHLTPNSCWQTVWEVMVWAWRQWSSFLSTFKNVQKRDWYYAHPSSLLWLQSHPLPLAAFPLVPFPKTPLLLPSVRESPAENHNQMVTAVLFCTQLLLECCYSQLCHSHCSHCAVLVKH